MADFLHLAKLDVDTRGLRPARAALARLVAQDRSERDALAMLEGGRVRLQAQIKASEAMLARQLAKVEREASGIVDALRKGVTNFPLPLDRRPKVVPDLGVAHSALAQADRAIAAKRDEIEAIAKRVPAAVEACLREEAERYADEYNAALSSAAEAAARLAGLDRLLGNNRPSRSVIIAPRFPHYPGNLIDTWPTAVSEPEITAAQTKWADFSRIIAQSPRADAARFLRFAPRDPEAATDVTYEDMTPTERRIADVKWAHLPTEEQTCTQSKISARSLLTRGLSAAQSPLQWGRANLCRSRV